MIRVGVIGCGLMGQARLKALHQLVAEGLPIEVGPTCDSNPATQAVFYEIDAFLASKPDWVIVALPHDVAVETVEKCLEYDFNVLVEKPIGRTFKEATKIAPLNRVHVGMNYRFYPGVRKALQDARAGLFGDLISVDMVLGHGGKPGDEKTWKLDPVRAGGGCLLDPGIHLLDLACIMFKSFPLISGDAHTGLWNTDIEDLASVTLTSELGRIITLRASTCMWRNTFKLEIHGTEGYGIVEGRGGNYGRQTYKTGKRWAWQTGNSQRNSEKELVTSNCEKVFVDELRALFFTTDEWPGPCTSVEALETMKLYTRIRERLGL